MTSRRYGYLRDPAAIYRASFDTVRRETDLSHIPAELHPLALRIVHACGDPGIVAHLAWSDSAAAAGRTALAGGASILCDTRMVETGIIHVHLPESNRLICTLTDPRVTDLARDLGTTRSAAAVELWQDMLEGAVVAIGNAPTALFHLLEGLAAGWPKPALILGFPVGFVGAAESKDALIADAGGIPYVTLRGRAGGSAIAAAAVNALAGDGN
ncbi:MAG: precorrin-8X methylmutase [Alphaproteobacteria bacterium]|nr:precorrin-8X methylmutase [Alphaproteobacteria bacterium]